MKIKSARGFIELKGVKEEVMSTDQCLFPLAWRLRKYDLGLDSKSLLLIWWFLLPGAFIIFSGVRLPQQQKRRTSRTNPKTIKGERAARRIQWFSRSLLVSGGNASSNQPMNRPTVTKSSSLSFSSLDIQRQVLSLQHTACRGIRNVIFLVFQGFGGKRSDCRIKEWFSNPWHSAFRRSIP